MATEWRHDSRVGYAGRATSALIGCCVIASANAQQAPTTELQLGVRSSIGVSDNVARSSTDEVSDVIAGIGFVGSWHKPEGRLRGQADFDVAYYSYLDDTFDDRVLGGLSAFAEYDLIVDRLSWMVRDNFGQTEVDPFLAANPGNVENVNYFTTGPDLTLQFGPRTYALIYGRYSNLAYETTQSDNERLEGGLSLRRDLSETMTVSLNGSQERVEYKYIPPGSSFDRQEAYVGLNFERQRTTLELNGGVTWLHDRGETFDGPLWRVSLTRRIGAYSSVTLYGGEEFSDAGDVFRFGQDVGAGGLDNPDNVFANPDPFERQYVVLGWRTEKERTSFGLSANWEDESYETQTQFDRERYGLRADATHALTQRTQLTASLYGTRQDYREGFEEDEWRFDLIYGWQIAQPLYIDFTYRRFFREASNSSGTAIENMLFMSLTYNFAQ